MSIATRYLIAQIPQANGGVRRLYARTEADAAAARSAIAMDRAMVDRCAPAEYVDVERDGTARRYVMDGQP